MNTVKTSAETTPAGGPIRWLGMRVVFWALLVAAVAFLGFALTPARLRYHLRQGHQELAKGKLEAAQQEFLAARQVDPRYAETYFWLARIERKKGNAAELRRHLDEALRRGYSDPDRLTREWWLFQAQTGQMAAVEPRLAGLLRKPGEDGAEICEAFAQGYCMNLQFEAALMLLEAWQTDYPNDYRPHLRRGRIFSEGNFKSARAEDALREALALAPDNLEVHRELGKALLVLRKLDEAEEQLRLAVEIDPLDEQTQLTLASVQQERGDIDAARDTAQHVLKQNPRHEKAQKFLAEMLVAEGEFDEAIRLLTPLVEMWPEDLKARYNLAKALAQGRAEEAEHHFQEYAKLEQSGRRMHDVQRELDRNLHKVELRYELGQLLLRHQSRAEGAAWLQSVFLYDADHQGAHRVLADYYARIGENDLALQHRLRLKQPAETQEVIINANLQTEK